MTARLAAPTLDPRLRSRRTFSVVGVTPTLERATQAGAPIVLKILCVLMFLPEELSFYLGSFRLTLSRLVLLLVTPVAIGKFLQLIGSGQYRFVLSDFLLPLTGLWMLLASSVIDNFDVKSSGIIAMELCVPYLLARAFLTRPGQLTDLCRFLCLVISIIGLLSILDEIVQYPITRKAFGAFTGYEKSTPPDYRLGLMRAFATMEHPILLGTACAFGVLLASALTATNRTFLIMGALIGLTLSVSSAPIGALIIGLGLRYYDYLLRNVAFRWNFILTTFMLVLAAIVVFHQNPRGFIISIVALNAETAYYRLYLYDWVTPFILNSPYFGIGFAYNVVPKSELPTTLDSFWYVLALNSGIPCAVLMFTSLIATCTSSIEAKFQTGRISPEVREIGVVLTILMFLTIYIATTVHFWGTTMLLMSLLMGMRAHIVDL